MFLFVDRDVELVFLYVNLDDIDHKVSPDAAGQGAEKVKEDTKPQKKGKCCSYMFLCCFICVEGSSHLIYICVMVSV